jgi:exodeoxyribonuclease VII small subunit
MSAPERHDHGSESDDPVEELSYTAASRELDGIVEFFEKSEVDVDHLVARLERATAIVDELDKRIRRTRAQVEELVPKLEAVGRAGETEESNPEDARDELETDHADRGSPSAQSDEDESDRDTLPF